MCCGHHERWYERTSCCCGTPHGFYRRFLSKGEKVERLKAYMEDLQAELEEARKRLESLEKEEG